MVGNQITRTGGMGGAGQGGTANDVGGGGGSGAGTLNNGNNGLAGSAGGTGGAAVNIGGGKGGNGGSGNTSGQAGSTYGGGGGGASDDPNSNGGNGANGTVIITWTCPTDAGTLSGTQNICVSGTTTFTSTVPGGTWSTGNATVASVNSNSGLVTGLSAGTTIITYTVASDSCATRTATREVTVVADPTAPTIAKDPDSATVCEGTILTVTVTPGTGGFGCNDEFRYSTNGGTTWSAWSTTVPSFAAVTGINLVQSRRSCTGSGCEEVNGNQVSWTVVDDPVAPVIINALLDLNVCTGVSLSVTVTLAGSGGLGCQDEFRFSIDAGANWSAWTDTVPTFSAVAGVNLIQSRRNCTGLGCESDTNQVSWTVAARADAGPDRTDASTCGLTSVTLEGNDPILGSGTWTIFSGTGGIIDDPNDPNSGFTGQEDSTYELVWTITNIPCLTTSDTVKVTFHKNPSPAMAGIDQTSAATCGIMQVTLNATAPTLGTGAWSIVSGSGGIFADSLNPGTLFNGMAGATYVLQWTNTLGICTRSDSVTITFNQNPTPAVAGGDFRFGCNAVLEADTLVVGTGAWTVFSGPSLDLGQFNDPTSASAIFSPAGGLGAYTLVWTTSNAPCPSTTDTVVVTRVDTTLAAIDIMVDKTGSPSPQVDITVSQTGFDVYRYYIDTSLTAPGWIEIAVSGSNTLMDFTGFDNGITYDVQVCVVCTGFDSLCAVVPNALLPIELLSFKARLAGGKVLLTWTTASELNNDYMAVERSPDGVNFTEIGRVQGKGTTLEPQSYSLTDGLPLNGLNYYRLRQVDFDGTETLHRVVSVLFRGKGSGSALAIQAFPNPAGQDLQVSWNAPSEGAANLRLFDPTGRLLAQYSVAAGKTTFTVPLARLPAGLYFIQLTQGQLTETVKFTRE